MLMRIEDTHRCSATTKGRKAHPCPIPADRCRGESWYCHVHDPEGTFRQQMEERQRLYGPSKKRQRAAARAQNDLARSSSGM